MGNLIEIDECDAHKYIPYIPGMYTENSKKNISTCKYFSKTPDEKGWDKISYYYDLK
jgi:hypothetical protein